MSTENQDTARSFDEARMKRIAYGYGAMMQPSLMALSGIAQRLPPDAQAEAHCLLSKLNQIGNAMQVPKPILSGPALMQHARAEIAQMREDLPTTLVALHARAHEDAELKHALENVQTAMAQAEHYLTILPYVGEFAAWIAASRMGSGTQRSRS